MTTELVTIDFRREYPVFPLPDCVLMPQAILPLHVFEPRYVKMIDDAIDSFGMIAMALFEGPVDPQEYESGKPALKPYVCIGQLNDYRILEDGSYIVLLQGLCRAMVADEVKHEPYRMVRVSPVPEVATDEKSLRDYRYRIEMLMRMQFLNASNDGVRSGDLLGKEVSTAVMVDLAIATVCADAKQRYRLLAQRDARLRAAWLVERMETMVGQRLGEHSDN